MFIALGATSARVLTDMLAAKQVRLTLFKLTEG